MSLAADQNSHDLNNLAIIGGWLLLFLVGIFAYWPGLHGPFLLDDYGSIGALGDFGGVSDWRTFKAFVFGGHAGPTGRPLPLLSFLIDGTTWPTDPWPFKRTNLVIHFINGLLLGLLTARILQILEFDRRSARWIALLSTAFWLLHPFLVSTTLYAVQRMAQLSTLFMFAGIATYLHGRVLVTTNTVRAYSIMTLSLGFFTFLAMISKENGVLLPLVIGVIEITVIASQRGQLGQLNRYWAVICIVVPSVAIAVYLSTKIFSPTFFEIVPPREFSIYERLLTQARILVDYLQNWFIPKLYTTGIYQDHFIKSTGLFSPLSTAAAIVFHIVIISVSVIYRQKKPLLAMAALTFYAGHLLESTVLNLELYFEHRNYMPTCFLFLPLVAYLWQKLSGRNFILVGASVILLLGGFTRYSATVWSSLPSIVEASARKAPTSPRAQAKYATMLFNAGHQDESIRVLDRAIAARPDDNALLLLNRIIVLCNMNSLSKSEYEKVAAVLSASNYDPRLLKAYNEFTRAVVEERCPEIKIGSLESLFVDMLKLPQNSDRKTLAYSNIKYLIGYVYVYSGRPADALASFEESLREKPDASYAMAMAAQMATANFNEEALHLANQALMFLQGNEVSVLAGARVRESDIKEFQNTVRSDMLSQQDAGRAN